MQRRRCTRPLHSPGEEKSPGIALHQGGHATPALLDYDGIVVGQLRVPTRHGKCPPYMKIIFPSAESRAVIDIYSSGLSRYILYVLWKSVRIRVIVLHRKSRRRSQTTGRYLRHVTMQNDESWRSRKGQLILWKFSFATEFQRKKKKRLRTIVNVTKNKYDYSQYCNRSFQLTKISNVASEMDN